MVLAIFMMWLAFTIPACFILSNKHRGAGYYILAVFFPPIGLIVAPCLKKLPIEKGIKKLPIEAGIRSTQLREFMVFVVMVSAIIVLVLAQTFHLDIELPSAQIEQVLPGLIISVIFTIPACFILQNKHRGDGYYILTAFIPVIGFIVALCLKKLPAEEQPQIQANDLDITNETRKK